MYLCIYIYIYVYIVTGAVDAAGVRGHTLVVCCWSQGSYTGSLAVDAAGVRGHTLVVFIHAHSHTCVAWSAAAGAVV
jgi:hypothetical protein